ncbi:hypothetical protein GGF46_004563 [Coemansia sp. RSA 552]|nr:hypothetical protein GGF46_004563 [Coemansia sp. RSA 552]
MAEFAFGHEAEREVAGVFTQHYYPVVGVLNHPATATAMPEYGRQVGRAVMRHLGGGEDSSKASGWDPVGPARGPRWQTMGIARVDDVPRRGLPTEDLSPRTGKLRGGGVLAEQWIQRQQSRPAVVMSMHQLGDAADDARQAEELARNRVCLASYGLAYMVVMVVGRGASEDGGEARLAALVRQAGLDAAQVFVSRPGTAAQFQAFVHDLERQLFTRAAAFYAGAFMRAQTRLAGVPQLPLPPRPEQASALKNGLQQNPAALRALADSAVVSRFSQHLPVRAWLVRYHFKLAVFSECAGDRDTAQRCIWLAYMHLLAYVGEIAAGAYLPGGWMWDLNGGDDDGQRAHDLRMFGHRWEEALRLLAALNQRLIRGWMYQSLDLAALRASNASRQPASSSWGFSSNTPRFTVTAVARSGRPSLAISAGGTSASSLTSSANASPAARAATPTGGGTQASAAAIARSVAGGNGSLDPLVLSVHAGEMHAGTEQMMEAERMRRRDSHMSGDDYPLCFVALGSESTDVDLLQPVASRGWWPLGGFHGVVDFSRHQTAGAAPRVGLVLNSSQDVSCTAAMLPTENHYDQCLTLAARQAAEHVLSLVLVLKRAAGFGEDSSYLWACVQRQYEATAALYTVAAEQGMGFGRALARAAMVPPPAEHHLVGLLVVSLRQHSLSEPGPSNGAASSLGRSPKSAFAGFAFDQALATDDSVLPLVSLPIHPSHDAASGGLLFPLWMWPQSAASLFHAAAAASLRCHRQLLVESRIYLNNDDGSPVEGGKKRVFSANPGVENTYVSTWVVKQQQAQDRTCSLLAAALASVAESGKGREPRSATLAASKAAATGTDPGALLALIASGSGGQYLALASELAEAYADGEPGQRAMALKLFQALASRFRAEEWVVLTANALRWASRCAVDNQEAWVRATVELLAPQLELSDTVRGQMTDELLDSVSGESEPIVVDMAQIHSPVRCHAHWLHWKAASDAQKVSFQVTFDCRALTRALPLAELTVEIGGGLQQTIRLTCGHARDLTMAGEDVRVYEVHGGDDALELRPGIQTVVEGSVPLDEGVSGGSALVLEAVVASVGCLRMRWPTCAPGTDNDMRDPGNAAAEATAENSLVHVEKLMLGRMGVNCTTELRLQLPLRPEASIAGLRRAIRIEGPALGLAAQGKWLHTEDGQGRWMQMPTPPMFPIGDDGSEPAFSVYSRCRVVQLSPTDPVLELSFDEAALPAYYGELFPLKITVRNAHTSRPVAAAELDVQLNVELNGETQGTWLQRTAEDGSEHVHEINGLDVLGGEPLMPQESRATTVYLQLPDVALHSARKPAAPTEAATIVCMAKCAYESGVSLHAAASTQTTVSVVRPLYADVVPFLSHVPAPAHLLPRPDSADKVPESTTIAAEDIAGTGEYCFRRPVLVRLHNIGASDLAVEKIMLRPPLIPEDRAPLRVQLAGSTAAPGAVCAGGSVEHVFWLDIFTADVVRVPRVICPGTLEVTWRRDSVGPAVLTRLWIGAVKLVSRQVQVEAELAGQAVVGQPLSLCYRVLNPTRTLKTVETSLHAADGFVFAGPRRTTLNILPGYIGLLRFTMVPLTATSSADSAPVPVPNHLVLGARAGLPSNAAGLGWMQLPRLDVRLMPRHGQRQRSRAGSSSSSVVRGATSPAPSTGLRGLLGAKTPPPTREFSATSLGHDADARQMVIVLAGLDERSELSPDLDAVRDVPDYLYQGVEAAGAESDFEEEDGQQKHANAQDEDEAVERYDPSTVFCMPGVEQPA